MRNLVLVASLTAFLGFGMGTAWAQSDPCVGLTGAALTQCLSDYLVNDQDIPGVPATKNNFIKQHQMSETATPSVGSSAPLTSGLGATPKISPPAVAPSAVSRPSSSTSSTSTSRSIYQ